MKAVIYFTEVAQQYEHKNMEHMIGEKLLETARHPLNNAPAIINNPPPQIQRTPLCTYKRKA